MPDLRALFGDEGATPAVDVTAIEGRARRLRRGRVLTRLVIAGTVLVLLFGVAVVVRPDRRSRLQVTAPAPSTTAPTVTTPSAPDEELLVARRHSLDIVRASDGATVRVVDPTLDGESVASLAVESDGSAAYVVTTGGVAFPRLHRVDLATGARTPAGLGYSPAISPDGRRLAYLGYPTIDPCDKNEVKVLDRASGTSVAIPAATGTHSAGGQRPDGPQVCHQVEARTTFGSVQWLPDSRHVVVGVHHGPASGIGILDVDAPSVSPPWTFVPVGTGILPEGLDEGRYRAPAALNADTIVALRPGCTNGIGCSAPNAAIVTIDRAGAATELVPAFDNGASPDQPPGGTQLGGLTVDASRTRTAVWGGYQLYEAVDHRLRPIPGDAVAAAWLPRR